MDPQTAPASSKTLYAIIGILLGIIIIGASTWLYLSNRPAPTATTPPTKVTATKTPTTAEANTAVTTAPTEIANALTELDNNLTVMKTDQDSQDDTINL